MPPRRRRSPRRTSRRPRPLDYLLAVMLVVGIGYPLLQRGVLPFPPEATQPSPEANGIVGFLLFLPDWWETAADMPIQLTLLQGGSSAFQTGPIAP